MTGDVLERRPPGIPAIGAALRRSYGENSARFLAFAIVASALTLLYYELENIFLRSGFASGNLLFFSEKAALALRGTPPGLVNLGFVYPPLSFLLILPFGSVFLAQAVIAGLAIAAIVTFLDLLALDRAVSWLTKIYVIFSPIMLFVCVENYTALVFALTFAASLFFFELFLEREFSLYIFAGAALLGITFLIDFRSIIVVFAIVPAMIAPALRAGRSQTISVAITVSAPILFFAAAWAYINYVFLGDPFAFVRGDASYLRTFVSSPTVLALKGHMLPTIWFTIKELVRTMPMTLPYFVGMILLRDTRRATVDLIPLFIIYAAPILLLGFSVFIGAYRPASGFLAIFIFSFIFSLRRMHRSPFLPLVLTVSFAASFLAPALSADIEERSFMEGLYLGHITPNLTESRAIADRLASATPDERILMDDTTGFAIAALIDAPERFILPYQYEFSSALSSPSNYAHFVVVRRTRQDMIFSLYPATERGTLTNFHETLRTANFTVLERNESVR